MGRTPRETMTKAGAAVVMARWQPGDDVWTCGREVCLSGQPQTLTGLLENGHP